LTQEHGHHAQAHAVVEGFVENVDVVLHRARGVRS
jgi:hypothetical protein